MIKYFNPLSFVISPSTTESHTFPHTTNVLFNPISEKKYIFSVFDDKQVTFMKVIHHLYKDALPLRLSVSEKKYSSEITNVGMAVEASPKGVIWGLTVTVHATVV